MIMCVLLCYPVSIHMSQLLSTGHPISSLSIRLHPQPCLSIQVTSGKHNFSKSVWIYEWADALMLQA